MFSNRQTVVGRHRIMAGLFLMLLAAMAGIAAPPQGASLLQEYWANRQPNIILIVAGDISPDDLGRPGQTNSLTPNLDRLAAEGMRFTQFYAGSPISAASRATLMTGRHTGQLNLKEDANVSLASNVVTVAEVLKSANYSTGVLGVWGLGTPGSPGIPTEQGFDEWLGYLSLKCAEDFYPTQLWRNADILTREKNFYGYRGELASDLIATASTNFVRVNKLRPFFLYLAYPLPPPPLEEPSGPASAINRPAMFARLDSDIGKLMNTLQHLKIDNHTLIFFTGATRRAPRQSAKFSVDSPAGVSLSRRQRRILAEDNLLVPMFARWPGKIEAGTTNRQAWALWDLMPTAVDAAGIDPPAGMDGRSMLPALQGQAQTNQHPILYWQTRSPLPQQALRMGQWKAMRTGYGKALELYNLELDPQETNNVARLNPSIASEMEAGLNRARTSSPR